MACFYCDAVDVALIDVCGTLMCHECEEMERTTDWDAVEEDKRRRIAESNEY